MNSVMQNNRKNSLPSALLVCLLSIFVYTVSSNAAADGRSHKKHYHSKHYDSYQRHGKSHRNQNFHQYYDDHKHQRYYRTPSRRHQGFSFNAWSFKPIAPTHRNYRRNYHSDKPRFHYHNSNERCYSNHTSIIINRR